MYTMLHDLGYWKSYLIQKPEKSGRGEINGNPIEAMDEFIIVPHAGINITGIGHIKTLNLKFVKIFEDYQLMLQTRLSMIDICLRDQSTRQVTSIILKIFLV